MAAKAFDPNGSGGFCLPSLWAVNSYRLFGYRITPLTAAEQLSLLTSKIHERVTCVITYLNLHGLYVLQSDEVMNGLYERSDTHVVIDGMPIVALSRLAGIPLKRQHRVTNLDLIWPLLSLAARRHWRVYYVGSSNAVLESGLNAIRQRLPDLLIDGHHGFIDVESPDVIARIKSFGADLVIVGMGTPIQEHWISANVDALDGASVLAVGALLEYIAGMVRTPPRWMGRYGLEWLFRFVENPRRFWRRYLVEPWVLAWLLAQKPESLVN